MTLTSMKNTLLAILSVAGGVIASELGGWDNTLKILVGIMVIDYATGILVAIVGKSNKTESGTLSSSAGFQGLCKKCLILMLVWLGVLLDGAIGANYIRQAVCLFFTANEGLSVLENAGLMGVPYPHFLKNILEALKEKK